MMDSRVIIYAGGERVSEHLMGTKEAATLFGVRPSNFIRDWASREDFPKPVATLARGRLWAREDLEVFRARTGPRRAVALADLPLSPDAARWLPVIKRRIVRRFRPDRIVLFGSQARGDARPDSDVDLLVVLPGNAHRRHAEAAIYASLVGIPLGTDVVVVHPEDIGRGADLVGTIVGPILREGRTVYVHA
jgi:predicted nucleotidyltransferase